MREIRIPSCDREDEGLTPEELEAAWREAMAEASRENNSDEDGWEDDYVWATGPGPGHDQEGGTR